MMNHWPLADLFTVQSHGNTLWDWGKIWHEVIFALGLCPICDAVSPIASIHGSRNQEVELGMSPLADSPGDPLQNVQSLSHDLTLCCQEVLVLEENMSTE